MNRQEKDTAETLSHYLKEAGGSLFSLRNSFSPPREKRMSESEKALLTEFYGRARKDLLGNLPAETVNQTKDFP